MTTDPIQSGSCDATCYPRRFATYDNPDTGNREWYRNGKLTAHVDRRIIKAQQNNRGPNQLFTDEALELWEPGNIKGDEAAIPEDNDKGHLTRPESENEEKP